MPVEPPPTAWTFPDPERFDPDDDLVGVGADLDAGTLLAAYRRGLFPMPGSRRDPMYWFSPVQRGVLPLDGLKVSRSLRRSARDLEIRVDTAFDEVITACADPARPAAGSTAASVRRTPACTSWAGRTRSRPGATDGLVGGLYGVAIGGLFAGESMFHRERDASKVALVGLVELLRDEHADDRVLDVQWQTPHLESLGVIEVPRAAYLSRLAAALEVPLPAAFDDGER